MNVLMAFTAQQVARLASISVRRLRYWEETDVFRPEYVEQRPKGAFRKIYSFRDLVNLRTLALLRDVYGIQLDELRRAGRYLRDHVDTPELALRVHGTHLAFRIPGSDAWISTEPLGQAIFTLELETVHRESASEARRFMSRAPEEIGRVTRNRNVMSNAWVVAGTRIPVEAIVELRRANFSPDEIMAQYPTLQPEDIAAALEHAELGQRAA